MAIGKQNVTDSNGLTKTGLFNNANNSSFILATLDKDICKIEKVSFHVLPGSGALKERSAFLCLSNTINPQVATTYISVFKTIERGKIFLNLLYVLNTVVQFTSKSLLYSVGESYRWKNVEVDFRSLTVKISLSEEEHLVCKDECCISDPVDMYQNVSHYYVALVNDKDIGLSELTDFYMSEISL